MGPLGASLAAEEVGALPRPKADSNFPADSPLRSSAEGRSRSRRRRLALTLCCALLEAVVAVSMAWEAAPVQPMLGYW